MITDKQMVDLGFRKIKTFKKRKNGVSSFCWEKFGLILTIEKDLGSDFLDEHFLPTLRIGNAVWYFEELSHLKALLKVLENDDFSENSSFEECKMKTNKKDNLTISNEDIEKQANKSAYDCKHPTEQHFQGYYIGYKNGCNWMRKKIKEKISKNNTSTEIENNFRIKLRLDEVNSKSVLIKLPFIPKAGDLIEVENIVDEKEFTDEEFSIICSLSWHVEYLNWNRDSKGFFVELACYGE